MLHLPGTAICQRAAELRKSKDPSSIVWDEITAFPMVYAFATLNWKWLIVGFVLFRFFDIGKPWPVRQLENLPGGFGIITDDVVAGIYAAACLAAIQFLNPSLPWSQSSGALSLLHGWMGWPGLD